jgi:Domain of unknown function (DUF6443)
MKKYLFLASFLLTFTSFAQEIASKKDTIKIKSSNQILLNNLAVSDFAPPVSVKSPNISALERYGNQPVSMYNGLIHNEIPIHEFQVGGLTIPIKLTYHASGIKVADRASWVGLGWSLQAGGAIYRSIKGKRDENDFGANNDLLRKQLPNYEGFQTAIPCLTETLEDNLDDASDNISDVERDVFTCNLPNKNNSFVLTPDVPNYIWQVADKSKISYTGPLTNFTLTDENGYKFDFNASENTSIIGGESYISAWHLNTILGTKPTEKAVFTYQANSNFNIQSETIYTEVYRTEINGGNYQAAGAGGNISATGTSSDVLINSVLPDEIYFSNGKIKFNASTTNRLDGLGKSLSSIEVYGFNVNTNDYSLIKKMVLNQTYLDGRLFLNSVDMKSADNQTIGTYSCTYNPEPLPTYNSLSVDFWGYSNGQTNTTLIPAQNFVSQEFTAFPQSPTTYPVGSYTGVTGANRTPNETKMQARMLTKMTFPTGGFSNFYYEANRNQSGEIVGSLRIKQVISNDGGNKTITKTYKYGIVESGNGTYRDIWLNIPNRTYSTTQYFKHPTITAGSDDYNYTLTVFSSAYTQPLTGSESSIVTYPTVTEYDDNGVGTNGKTVYTFKDDSFDNLLSIGSSVKLNNKSTHWNRGQLLSKTTFGADSKIKYNLTNSYTKIIDENSPILGYLIGKSTIYLSGWVSNNGGCLAYPGQGTNNTNYTPIQNYRINVGLLKLSAIEEKFYDDTNDNKYVSKKTEIDYNANFMPSEIRDFDSSGEIRIKKNRYVSDFSNLNVNHTGNALALYWMKENNEISLPIEELSFRKKTDNSIRLIGGKFTKFEIKDYNSNKYVLPDNISILEIPESPVILENAFSLANLDGSGNINIDSRYSQRVNFGDYDGYGNLLNYSQNSGKINAIGYSTTQTNNVFHNFITSETQNYGSSPSLTTSQTFDIPLLGPSSITAPNGLKTYFNYDTFGRMKRTKDHSGKYLNEYVYQYAPNKSFIKETNFRAAVDQNSENFSASSSSAQYFDGLGRSTQTIDYQANGAGDKHVATSFIDYDNFGREAKSFIPFHYTGGSDVETAPNSYEGDNFPFSQVTEFDNSPLNRPKKIYGPGQKWRDDSKFTEIKYLVADNGAVQKYSLNPNGNGGIVNGAWGEYQISKTVYTSENGNETIEYKDNDGRLIEKAVQDGTNSYISTAYVYDDFDRLKYTIQPKLFEAGINFTDTDDFIFGYKFDARGRTIEKKLPSAETEYLVYDKYDRLVMSQNGLQRHYLPNLQVGTTESPKWQFYKYDGLDRMVYSGVFNSGSTRETMQSDANLWAGGRSESKNNANPFYTLNSSFPQIANEADVKSVSFFDDYNYWLPNGMAFDNANKYHENYTTNLGLSTGSLARKNNDNSWLAIAVYFDNKSRVIQAFSQNVFNKINKTDIGYNFAGEPLNIRTVRNYLASSSSIELVQNNFDHIGRLKNTIYSIDGITKSNVDYAFDQVGRLASKNIMPLNESIQSGNWNNASTWRGNQIPLINGFARINKNQTVTIPSNTTANVANILNEGNIIINAPNGILNLNGGKFQKIDFAYNLRGYLRGINLDGSGNIPNSFVDNDLFAYKLDYETESQYDGKIGKQSWRRPTNITSPNTTDLRTYSFNYDASNRLKSAAYQNNGNTENFSLNNVNYDKNSNITKLEKYGNVTGNFGSFMDNLSFNYSGNKAINVTDEASGNNTVDFTQVGTGARTYYQDGSLMSDQNKGIDGIIYDPFTLQASQINMTGNRKVIMDLSSDGEVLERKFTTGTNTDELWQYDGGMVFKGVGTNPTETLPYSIAIPEGRLVYQAPPSGAGGLGLWEQEYQISDHLGNVRATFKNNKGIAQAVEYSDFDPNGLLLNTLGQRHLNATENRFLFQDKESFSTFGLNGFHDFGPRFLDKTIGGIWNQPDIMAENYSDFSPFNYVFSNPLSYIDPSGMTPDQASDGYSNIDTRNTSGSISFFSFGGQGMSTDDPAKKKSTSGMLPGANTGRPQLQLASTENREPYKGFWANLDYFFNGGIENGSKYDKNGKFLYRAPIALTINLPVGPNGPVNIVKYVKDPKKIIVLGENMAEKVIPYAKKINGSWFKARGTNPARFMKNQIQWIDRQLKDANTMIINIGQDLNRNVRSKYYLKELERIEKWFKNK